MDSNFYKSWFEGFFVNAPGKVFFMLAGRYGGMFPVRWNWLKLCSVGRMSVSF